MENMAACYYVPKLVGFFNFFFVYYRKDFVSRISFLDTASFNFLISCYLQVFLTNQALLYRLFIYIYHHGSFLIGFRVCLRLWLRFKVFLI
jgi:hypothetical protein